MQIFSGKINLFPVLTPTQIFVKTKRIVCANSTLVSYLRFGVGARANFYHGTSSTGGVAGCGYCRPGAIGNRVYSM